MKDLKKLSKNAIVSQEKANVKGGNDIDVKGPKTPPNPCFDPRDKLAWYCPACSRG